jgi:hypothetical protein
MIKLHSTVQLFIVLRFSGHYKINLNTDICRFGLPHESEPNLSHDTAIS